MKFDQTFNFHGLVGLRVQTSASFTANYFQAEYGPAAGALSAGLPEVVLRWTESRLPSRPEVDYRLKIHKGLARWYYRVHFDPRRILIEAVGTRIAVPMVHHMLVHGCLRYLCSAKDILLLHAAALAHRDRSLILAGSGGAGKTTVSSIVMDQGGSEWELHADDYVFMSSGGDTYSYPSRSHLYADLMKAVPTASRRLSARQRAHLTVFGLARKMTSDRIKWPLRVESGQIWPDRGTAPHATLRALLLLEPSSSKNVEFKPIDEIEHLVDKLIRVNFYEARHTIELVKGTDAPKDFLERWKSNERETLRQALREIPAYHMLLPPTENLDRSKLVSVLQQLVSVEDGIRVAN